VSWFAKIEETCAAFIERAFANMFPSDLEPAQIARKLVAVMEARAQSVESTIVAPSRYRVNVNPNDYARLSEHREYLEREWCALLTDVAQRVGMRFDGGDLSVTLCEDPAIVAGAIDVAVDSAQFRLRLVKGAPPDHLYPVSGTLRVGRDSDCDIFLVDPSVSRNHAVLEAFDGELLVRDNGSTNGTFVNGERIKSAALNGGDVVAFGKTEMRVEQTRP
jgi:hypothetical protein